MAGVSTQTNRRQLVLGGLLAVLVTLLTVLGYWYFRSPEATLVGVGDMGPELELPSLGGVGTTRLSQFRGRAVLLTMFMSKCRICESEIRNIERLHRGHLQRGLIVLGVSVDPDRETLRRFVKEKELTFFVLEDFGGRTVKRVYGSWKMPEHYLIDRDGRVAKVFLGSVNWRSREVIELSRNLLPQEPTPAQPRETPPDSSSSTAPTR